MPIQPATPLTLDVVEYAMMAGGAAILARWIILQVRRHRDPLLGAPYRANEITLVRLWLAVLLYALAGMIAGGIARMIRPPGLADDALDLWQSILASNLIQIIIIPISLWLARVCYRRGFKGLGLDGRLSLRHLGIALAGFLVAIYVCNVAAWLTENLLTLLAPHFAVPTHAVFQALTTPGLGLVTHGMAVLGAFILAPVGEELFFRGLIQSGMQRLWPVRFGSMHHRWAGILATSLLFGVLHLTTPQHVPALTLLAVILGYLYERTGSITVPIILHIMFNAKSLAWFYLQQYCR